MTNIDIKADEIVDSIYRNFASGTGILFGLPANTTFRSIVRGIVVATLRILEGGDIEGLKLEVIEQ